MFCREHVGWAALEFKSVTISMFLSEEGDLLIVWSPPIETTLTALEAVVFFGVCLVMPAMPFSSSLTAINFSKGLLSISPQSTTFAQFLKGLTPL